MDKTTPNAHMLAMEIVSREDMRALIERATQKVDAIQYLLDGVSSATASGKDVALFSFSDSSGYERGRRKVMEEALKILGWKYTTSFRAGMRTVDRQGAPIETDIVISLPVN